MLKVDQPPPQLAEALGLPRRAAKRSRKNGRSCADCFFHKNMLCALALDEPCSTFRPDSPDGLVPPRQPALLLRQGVAGEPLSESA